MSRPQATSALLLENDRVRVTQWRFAPGEASKQIVLSLVDDVYVEGPETLTLTLSDPTGTTLGQDSVATVTITDNDTGTQTTPTGTVTITSSDGDLIATSPCTLGAGGTCTVTVTASSVISTHTITATYTGDATHDTSTGPTSLTVQKRTTSTTVSLAS